MANSGTRDTVARHVAFHDLAQLCEKVSVAHGAENKKALLAKFLAHWKNIAGEKLVADPSDGAAASREPSLHPHARNSEAVISTTSFYPAMRLLVPQFERERQAYGIKEVSLAKLYIKILGLSTNSSDAQKLLNFRLPKNAKSAAGDFAIVTYFILKRRFPEKGKLSVEEVNTHLDNIALENAARNREKLEKSLCHLVHNMSALEQKWMIRMILKDMKLGISEQSILNAFHPDAKDLYDVTSSLEKVCTKLHDPSVRLHEIEVSLFSPFRPMLAEGAAPDKVESLMNYQPFYIETKYDGERSQIHKQGNKYQYFSRNCYDFTSSFGGSPLEGTFTPHIAKCFRPHVKNCILDGEMVTYHTELKCIVSKGENVDVKRLSEGGTHQPCFFAFDVLLLNDEVLTNRPLSERIEKLKGIFTPVEGRMELGSRIEGCTKADVINALNDAIDNHEEGIVVKNPQSKYVPNTRKGGWLKIKPEYVDGLMDQLDLVIIGGYFGDGRRRSGIVSHFLLGLAVPPSIPGDKPRVFHSFVKVGSGYSMHELYQLLIKLKDHWQVYSKQNPPSSIVLASGHKEKPDLWIEPSKSFVLQVKAAEIVGSDRFKTGLTLRFPRVEKVRYDKPWHECMTLDDLQTLRNQASGKLSSRRLEEGNEGTSPKKRRVVARTERPITLATHFRGVDVSEISQVSDEFAGKELCVISGPPSFPKQTLEKRIVECGGTIVQNPTSDTFCVISDKMNLRVKNICNGKYDVVKAEWLIRSLGAKKCLPWNVFDMWCSTDETSKRLAEEYDSFGDSYSEAVTIEGLKAIFRGIEEKDWRMEEVTHNEIADVEFEYFGDGWKFGIFRNCRVYLDDKSVVSDDSTKIPCHSLELTEKQLRFHGAVMTPEIDLRTTHVVVQAGDVSRVKALKDLNRRRGEDEIGRFHLVVHTWVEDCVREGHILSEMHYLP